MWRDKTWKAGSEFLNESRLFLWEDARSLLHHFTYGEVQRRLLFEQCLSPAGCLPIECCHRNKCWFVSVCIGFRCREGGEWGEETQEGLYFILEREREREDHTGHKETPTTRASPFIVHNTSLFTLLAKLVHFCVFKSINCYRGTWQGFAKQKEKEIFAGWFPTPSTRSRQGRERGRRQGTT